MQKAYVAEIKRLGKNVKRIRISKKMTQKALSGLCDVDIRTIQRIEKGEFRFGIHILFAISDAFEIDTAELLK